MLFGYSIYHACHYITRDRRHWQRRGHTGGTGAPWQLLCTFLCNGNTALHVSILYFFIYWDNCSGTGSMCREGKWKKDRETIHKWSLPMQHLIILGLKPQHKPRTRRVLNSLSCSGLTLRSGQARSPSTLLAMAIKRVISNEISCPKMNSHMGTTIQWGFHTPGYRQTKSSSVKYGQISELEATCLTFLWLCESEWPCDFLLSHMITHYRHTNERMPGEVCGCGTWNPLLVIYKP